jgi:FK506-binding protein 1
MSLGEKARLKVPPEYAYGARGFSTMIPPNAALIYEIELIAIEN